jgi:hypothetical protein
MSSSSAELIATAGPLIVGTDLTVRGQTILEQNAFLNKDVVIGGDAFVGRDTSTGRDTFVGRDIVGGRSLYVTGDSTVRGNTVTYGKTTSVNTIPGDGVSFAAVGDVNVGDALYTTSAVTRGSVDVASTITARSIDANGAYFGHAPSLTGVMPWAQFTGTNTSGTGIADYTPGVSPYSIPPLFIPTLTIGTSFNFLTPVQQPTGFYLVEGYLNNPTNEINAESIMTTVHWNGVRLRGCSAAQYFTIADFFTDFDCVQTGQGFFDYDQAAVEVTYTSSKGTINPPGTVIPALTSITMNVYKLARYGQVLPPLPPAPIIPAVPTYPPVIPFPLPPATPLPIPQTASQQTPMGGYVTRKKPKPMPMGPQPQ